MNTTILPPSPSGAPARFFVRHPRLTVLAVLAAAFLLLVVLAEVALRLFGSLNIHYYAGTKTPGLHRYPYGDVPINADGYPDEEFTRSGTKKRIGYLGDSVTYGVGAGYGYRTPDLLQGRFPDFDHWVFANVGERLEPRRLLSQLDTFRLDAVVYLMNLNDIVPDGDSAQAETWIVEARSGWMGRLDTSLRGASYLYTYLRLGLKNVMQRSGYESHGMQAFELAPRANPGVIEATAKRVADILNVVRSRGPLACVVILPYEMQVSKDAARTYRELGFSWEEGFESGSTQQMLIDALRQRGVAAFDGLQAFAGTDFKVGEAFVYDRGDKVDWNHPTRIGHARLADWLAATPEFAAKCFPSGGSGSQAGQD